MVRKRRASDSHFGNVLKSVIKEAKLSREALSERLGCSIETVDNWCCGRNQIMPSRLDQLCSLLDQRGVRAGNIRHLYDESLKSHGFSMSWPPARPRAAQLTFCVFGSRFYRKELSILQMISDSMAAGTHQTMVFHCGNSVSTLLSCLELAHEMMPANIVLCGVSAPPDIYRLILSRLEKEDCLVGLVRTDCPPEVVYPYSNAYAVTWSDFAIGYRATRILIEAGHKRIGTVYLERDKSRFEGYVQALKDSGIDPDPAWVVDRGTSRSYEILASHLFLTRLKRFVADSRNTALFAPTEPMTLVMSMALMKSGIRVPKDISLIGVAYPEWMGKCLGVPISYLRYPIEAVANKVRSLVLRHATLKAGCTSESRYVDVSSLARRIDTVQLGSIGRVGQGPQRARLD